ncbi:MAG: hypothetical protein DRJ26_03080 [Candidatus Methanomethylicota archaeon]|uniref:Uncharacterized protein n=1 Tax=Thermoproteota archaeon TaxID=2056631 RepID=A0A497F2W4_9CREN|nr:MAG: hypothetical protein DRJ26_03080 [Candidatus Verstraetearchaeota archaeon]
MKEIAKYITEFKKYLRENLGAPFIIVFMILLIIAASYLSLGMEATANELAVYAYYCLIIGVLLQIASYIKYNKERTLTKEKQLRKEKS